ncbi:MAG: ORC-CDC6 family AAA ATPase [Candidatus Hodarchaeales archaeon]
MSERLYNPFILYRAEKLINSTQFINNLSPQPLLQPEINVIFQEKNIILLGHPGSGKSMILRSIEYDNVQAIKKSTEQRFEETKSYLNTISNKEMWGIYFSFLDEFNATSFSDLKFKLKIEEKKVFLSYLCLFLIRKFISFLFLHNKEFSKVGLFKREISSELLIQPEYHNFLTNSNKKEKIALISKKVTKELSKIANFKRSIVTTEEEYNQLFIQKEEFFSIIIQGMLSELSPTKTIRVIFIIDDMQVVPEKYLDVIFLMMGNQYSNIEFKLGTRPIPEFIMDYDKRDLEIIDLEASHSKYKNHYSRFTKEVANIRLRQVLYFRRNELEYSSIIMNLDPEQMIEHIKESKEAFKEFDNEFKEFILNKVKNEKYRQRLVTLVQKYDTQLHQLIVKAMIIRRIQKYGTSPLPEIKNLMKYADDQLKKKQLKRFTVLSIARKAKSNFIYCGENTIFRLSSFIIKDFIEINFHLFESLIMRIMREEFLMRGEETKLTPLMQDGVLRRLSSEKHDWITKAFKNGLNFSKLIHEFISYNTDQFELPFSYIEGRSGIGIHWGEHRRFDQHEVVLNARALGFLLKFDRLKGKGRYGLQKKKMIYYFHRMLMVYFNYPIVFGGYKTYTPHELLPILEGKKESFKQTIRRQRSLLEYIKVNDD